MVGNLYRSVSGRKMSLPYPSRGGCDSKSYLCFCCLHVAPNLEISDWWKVSKHYLWWAVSLTCLFVVCEVQNLCRSKSDRKVSLPYLWTGKYVCASDLSFDVCEEHYILRYVTCGKVPSPHLWMGSQCLYTWPVFLLWAWCTSVRYLWLGDGYKVSVPSLWWIVSETCLFAAW